MTDPNRSNNQPPMKENTLPDLPGYPSRLPDLLKESPMNAHTFTLHSTAAESGPDACANVDAAWLSEVADGIADHFAWACSAASARAKSDILTDMADGGLWLRDAALSLADHHGRPINLGETDPLNLAAMTIEDQESRLAQLVGALPGLLADVREHPERAGTALVRLALTGAAIYAAAEGLAHLWWAIAAKEGDDKE